MKLSRITWAVAWALIVPGMANAQLNFTGTPLTENFDSMGPTGTTTPASWHIERGPGQDTRTDVVVSAGDIVQTELMAGFNCGSAGATDRALGTAATGPTLTEDRTINISILNSSGNSINYITVNYAGELWRVNNKTTPSGFELQYSADGTTWVAMGTNFSFLSPFTANTGPADSAYDGNLDANRRAVGGTYRLATPVPASGMIYLRWYDNDDSSTDPCVAIDDFTFAAGYEVLSAVVITTPTNGSEVLVGGNVTVTAVPNGSADSVEFYDNSVLRYTDTTSPYQVVLSDLTLGAHELYAVATGPDGTFVSDAVTFNVTNPVLYTTLLANGLPWKFNDTATDLGTDWVTGGYDDQTWTEGSGEIGFGDGNRPETTVLTGTATVDPRGTVYFRKKVTMPSMTGYAALRLWALFDDGIVVYINGTEVWRNNFDKVAPDPILFGDLATDAVGGDGLGYTAVELSTSALTEGENTIAAEVHQNSTTSSDLSFDLMIFGIPANSPPVVVVTNPPTNISLQVGDNLDVGAEASDDVGIDRVEFYLDDVMRATADTTVPYGRTIYNLTEGTHQLTAKAYDVVNQVTTSQPVTITVTNPGAAVATFVSNAGTWSYLAGTTSLDGTGWETAAYDVSTWPTGQAKLGYGGDGEFTLIDDGPDDNRYPTTYFRRDVNVTSLGTTTGLLLGYEIDDGAVVYVNGTEIFRVNVANTPPLYADYASGTVNDAMTFVWTNVPLAGLTLGPNTIAVEVHNVSTNSSDLGMDIMLFGVSCVVSEPKIAYDMLTGEVIVTWPSGTLYEASDPAGPYSATANASPYRFLPTADTKRFYQVGCP